MMMKITRRIAVTAGLSAVFSELGLSGSRAEFGELFHPIEGADDFWIATDAYIYGYPLVTVEMTRRVITQARTKVLAGRWAKLSIFGNIRMHRSGM